MFSAKDTDWAKALKYLTVCKEEQGCQVQRVHEEGKCGRVNEICENVAHPEQKLQPKFDPPTIFI